MDRVGDTGASCHMGSCCEVISLSGPKILNAACYIDFLIGDFFAEDREHYIFCSFRHK